MEQEPYRSAQRVFWIVDNGSSHRGAAAVKRLQAVHANAILVHLPVHASWLNQVEIYFSVIQRKVTPNDFGSAPTRISRVKRLLTSVLTAVTKGFPKAKPTPTSPPILAMSEKTVKIHLNHIFEKLNVETRTAAAMHALETLARARIPRA